MHTPSTLRFWMHHVHEKSVEAAHTTGHLFLTKGFWSVLAVLVLVAGLLALVAYFGGNSTIPSHTLPMPYGPYY